MYKDDPQQYKICIWHCCALSCRGFITLISGTPVAYLSRIANVDPTFIAFLYTFLSKGYPYCAHKGPQVHCMYILYICLYVTVYTIHWICLIKHFIRCVNVCARAICLYRKIANIRRTLSGYKIVDHSDVVGASPVGAAPTTSSFSTSLDWAKTTARRDEKQLSLGIWCDLY